MFLMYVDECGDSGMGAGSSDYFILSGMVVHESMWTSALSTMATDVGMLKLRYGIDAHAEIHAKGMLGRSEKVYAGTSKLQRIMMLRDLLKREGRLVDAIRVINVVVDKRSKNDGYDVFGVAWATLIGKFEDAIQNGRLPIVAPETTPAYPEHGMIIVDQTDEKRLRWLTRGMRHAGNAQSSSDLADASMRNLLWVIEDPMHKDSQHTIPIQLCDANAYFLRQLIAPNTTIKKHDARNYFYALLPVLLDSTAKNQLGVVWI